MAGLVVESGMVVGPELVVGSYVRGVRAAWLCMGPGLVLRVGLVVHGNRAGCAWGRAGGGRAGCTGGQD